MKTVKVVLYAEQVKACQAFFEKAHKESEKGQPGVVLAQVVKTNAGEAVMLVNYLPNKDYLKFCEATGKEPELLTELPG